MGSHSPMMAAAAGPAAGSSLVGGGSTIDGGHEGGPDAERGMLGAGLGGAAAGGIIGAGAMRSSRSSHRVDEDDESHPFTSDEATRMADAFRNALRKPEFANDFGSASQPSPDEGNGNGSPGEEGGAALLREELASEGKDLRDVGERRKATWHNDEAEAGTGRETS